MENTLAYYDTAKITAVKSFIVQAPGINVKKIFTAVIYITVILCYKSNYLGNYCGMEVKCCGILTPRNRRVEITMVINGYIGL